MSDRDKIDALEAFDKEKYANVSLDYLVMYTVGQLDSMGVDLSFENIAVACFRLFPAKFSLLGFPEYPATKRTHDCLFRCTIKPKFWLGGKTSQGFTVTDRSRAIMREAEKRLHGRSPAGRSAPSTSETRRKERILAELESTAAYKKYASGDADGISEADLCYMLEGTLDSSRDTLRKNLEQMKTFAGELARQDILSFLQSIDDRFRGFLLGK